MTKVRVHEIAKDLNKQNKDVIDFLRSKNMEVSSHMSSLSDEQIAMIKAEFGPKEEQPKKKNIVQVFRPQNSQSGRQGNRPNQGQKRPEGQTQRPERRPEGQGQHPEGQKFERRERPEGQRPEGQKFERRERPEGQGQRPEGQKFERRERPEGQRPERRPEGQGQRPEGQKFERRERPEGQKFERRERPEGQRQERRPEGQKFERRERPEGQRPERTFEKKEDKGFNKGFDKGFDRGFDKKDDYDKNDRRDDNRRKERKKDDMSIPAPLVPEQKSQRKQNKNEYKKKDQEKDFRANDQEDGRGGKKGKMTKNVPLAQKPQPKPQVKEEEKIKLITIPEVLTIKELADHMKVQPSVIVKKLFMQGKIVTMNQEIDYDTAEEIAMEFDVLCEKEEVVDVIEELLKEDDEDESKMKKRPPVVCVMGHVDHGKTSLLDAIRNTRVTSGEAGGITQHIGAYITEINGEKITFLDTPGHEAFTAMRMRGANSTDIAILVVAADDGVMPQTVEAISHAKAAGIDIIVAVNKIDKPSANVERVKQELTEYELIAEDWGGSTIFVPVSAKTGEGIEELLEMVLLTAEVAELKANPNRRARGLVIEAELDKGKGPVATVLVQKGTLRVGDSIAAGAACGKVRAMMDDKGRRVKEAGPSTPVEILGLNDVPNAGEVMVACGNEKEARSFADTFIAQNKAKLIDETKSKMSLDDLFTQIQAGNLKELGIIVKADVQGSVEAVKQSLLKLSNDEVVVKIIHAGVGAINESDVTLASTSNAIIIGFNVRTDSIAKETADREGVDIRLYRVIYQAIEDVQAAMKGMLDPIFEEKILGHAEVRQTFKASGVGTIAGSYVLDGTFERGCKVRITREGKLIFEGPLASLKRFKDDVKEVRAGYECGFVFEKFNDVKEFDLVEAYKMVEVPR